MFIICEFVLLKYNQLLQAIKFSDHIRPQVLFINYSYLLLAVGKEKTII